MARIKVTLSLEIDDGGDPPPSPVGGGSVAANRAKIAAEARAAAETLLSAAIAAIETGERANEPVTHADVRTLAAEAVEEIKRRILEAGRRQ